LGVFLGNFIPNFFQGISDLEYAKVNLVIAVLIWMMIYPMMVNVDFNSLKQIYKKPKGLCITLIVNWLIKPFTMTLLGILFFKTIFADLVDPNDAKEYIAGMVLLGIAPCTAMVFVWSKLVKGDATYTVVQVSINDIIMIFAFTPIAALLLGVVDIAIPWETLLLSVILYVLIPLIAGYITRKYLLGRNDNKNTLEGFSRHIEPCSMAGLLLTVIILFGLQANIIINKPFIIILIAIPLIIQSYGIFMIAYAWSFFWKVPHNIAAPSALIGTSNFFELAVAVAISLFGLESGAVLATVVGVLVEVPVMLSLVAISNRTKSYFIYKNE
jgi:ACR3 family arsenite transporter